MVKHIFIVTVVLGLLGLAGYYVYSQLHEDQVCTICHRRLHEETTYRVHLQGGNTQEVCCPRCGLRFTQGRDDVLAAEVTDYQSRERFDAREAIYVENSSVHPCSKHLVEKDRSGAEYDLAWDRCLPSLIAFKSRGAAEAFRRQKGGDIKTYEELLRTNP